MSAQPQLGIQPTTFANPLGINGFEFVEFAAPDPAQLHELFRRMGFAPVARHRGKRITLFRQGGVNFLLNEEPDSFAAEYRKLIRGHIDALTTKFSEHRIDYTMVNTAEPLDRSLFSYLSARERMMRVR